MVGRVFEDCGNTVRADLFKDQVVFIFHKMDTYWLNPQGTTVTLYRTDCSHSRHEARDEL